MNRKRLFVKVMVSCLFFVFSSYIMARPMWTFRPLTATNISVPANETGSVRYQVTNQSSRTKHLEIIPLQGITTNSLCNLGPKGQAGSSCTLILTVTGRELPENGVRGGPSLCQTDVNGAPNPNQCYQPAPGNILNITKTNANTSITASVSHLTLSVTGLTNGPTGPPVESGKARLITITNIGTATATDLKVQLPTLPVGSTASTTCGTFLPANIGNTCTITITPGATATSDGTNPCTVGTTPQAGIAQVTASNAESISTNVLILGYGCIFQEGYLFSVDDDTPNTTSIGGKVAALSDQTDNTRWSEINTAVGGIDQNSVASPNSCNGNRDGACNTDRIIAAGLVPPTAAQFCENLNEAGFDDWYLPAICEMGYDLNNAGTGCGSQNNPFLQNLYSVLRENNLGNFANEHYWSSTEFEADAANQAWETAFQSTPDPEEPGNQGPDPKDSAFSAIRCARAIT